MSAPFSGVQLSLLDWATPEEWRPIPGHEGAYEVSSYGRVRSLDRYVSTKGNRRIFKRGRILKPFHAKRGGYPQYRLGRSAIHTVHRLVLTAFVGPPPEGMTGSHLNGNPRDNRPQNLVWESLQDNLARKAGHGTAPSSLTERQVREIRKASGTYREIAARYGVWASTISHIRNRQTWKHIAPSSGSGVRDA